MLSEAKHPVTSWVLKKRLDSSPYRVQNDDLLLRVSRVQNDDLLLRVAERGLCRRR